jgi:hypothetical protein
MKKLALTGLVAILITNTASFGSSWDEGLYFAEVAIGAAAGLSTGLIIHGLVDRRSSGSGGTNWNALGAAALTYPFTVPLGVIISGNSIGSPPENPLPTYLATAGASIGSALISFFGIYFLGPDEAAIYGTVVVTPFATAAVYNAVKTPGVEKTEIGARVTISPYSDLLAESGGSLVPTYGVSIGF